MNDICVIVSNSVTLTMRREKFTVLKDNLPSYQNKELIALLDLLLISPF
jgi:hypothetical protein